LSEPLDANRIFDIHEDIRHVIIADFMGAVLEIHSRAKRQWPLEMQKQFSGVMAAIIFGISEKVQDIAGEIRQIIVNYEKMKIIIIKSAKYFYIISTRITLPETAIEELTNLIKRKG